MQEKRGFMDKMSGGIVKARWVIAAVFVALMVFSVFSIGWVKTEEDITVYLQDSAEAKQGFDIMHEEFTMFLTAQVMVEDVTVEEAAGIAEDFAAMDGVYLVDHDDSQKFNRDGAALFNLTFAGADGDEICTRAMQQVREYLEQYEDTYFYTDSQEVGNEILVEEMTSVLLIVVCVVIAVLIFTSSTYAEIPVLLITFATAAVIHMGTNFLLGTISLVSNAVTLVLQLALSVDYAIIFCNRYKEEHAILPVKEAVAAALAKAIPEIGASSLTTIAGLAAMTFMEFRLGADMGIVLIKAIVFSMLTVFLFMPVLLILFGKLMDKTKHKSFVPKVSFLGKFAHATRYIIPPIFVLLVAVGIIGYGRSDYGYAMTGIKTPHQNELDISLEHIEDTFGKNNFVAVLVPSGDYEKELALRDELDACEEVNSVLSLAGIEVVDGIRLADKVTYRQVMDLADVDEITAKAIMAYSAAGTEDYREVTENLETYSIPVIELFLNLHAVVEEGSYELEPEQINMVNDLYEQLSMAKKQLGSENHSCLVVYVDLPVQSEETFNFFDRIHSIAYQYYDEGAVLTGNAVAAKDFANTFANDNRTVSTLSIVLVMLILLVTFRSVGIPILLILVIQGSIWLNFAIPAFMGERVFFMNFLIVSAIQMGANIDYAIVISSRYNELRNGGFTPKEAIIDTLNLAFPTVITSGAMMVASGLMIGFRVSQAIVAGMGKYVGIGTAISLMLVNFALPQILIFGDGFVRATTLRFAHKIGPKATRAVRHVAGFALAAAAALTFVVTPASLTRAETGVRRATEKTDSLLQRTWELSDIAKELAEEQKKLGGTKINFAERLLTAQIGEEELKKGREQYEAGVAELAKYKQIWNEGNEEYQKGLKEYEAGLEEFLAGQKKLEAGQAEYEAGVKAYEEGKAQLEAGQAEYDAGVIEIEESKKLLAEGQAEYDAGEAQLADGKREYAAAEALLNTVKPAYDAAAAADRWLPTSGTRMLLERLIAQYEDARAQLAAAAEEIAAGEKQLAAAKIQLDDGYAQLAAGEEKLAAGKKELDDGYAQLAEAEKQLRAAEKEIADGKVQLAEGQKELDAAKAQLDAGKKELDDGAAEIKAGEDQLKDAEKQIEAGVETLDQNWENLEGDLSALDEIKDDKEKLAAGMEIFRGIESIDKKAGYNSTEAEICTVAENYFESELQTLRIQAKLIKAITVLLLISALAAVIGLIFWLLKKYRIAAAIILLGVLGALAGAISWKMGCSDFGMSSFWAALALTVFGIVAADILIHRARETKSVLT